MADLHPGYPDRRDPLDRDGDPARHALAAAAAVPAPPGVRRAGLRARVRGPIFPGDPRRGSALRSACRHRAPRCRRRPRCPGGSGVRLIAPMLALAALPACDSGTESREEAASTRAVQREHTAIPYGTASRGTAARAAALASPGSSVTPELLDRGRERFLIFCSPCHGA